MGIYEDYLMHFNPNHDPRNGRFAKKTDSLARKAYNQYLNYRDAGHYEKAMQTMSKVEGLNEALSSNDALNRAAERKRIADQVAAEAWEAYVDHPIIDPKSEKEMKLFEVMRNAEKDAVDAYDQFSNEARAAIDKYLDRYGDYQFKFMKGYDNPLRSGGYRMFVEYAHKFFNQT